MDKTLDHDKVSNFFKKIFNKLPAKRVKNYQHLEIIADKVATCKTKYGARVFNKVYRTGRIPQQIFHSTVWRDKKITDKHLQVVKRAHDIIKRKKIPLYTFWIRSGSGNQTRLWQMFFTKKGCPLALAAAIMMEPIFTDPIKTGHKLSGMYFAFPDLLEKVKDEKEPLILINIGSDRLANIWVGGSDYPGEAYKPICKAHNGWLYDDGGFEIHGAAYVADYLNRKIKPEKSLVVITGLSLHGKSTLSTTNGIEPAFFEKKTNKKEVIFKGIHDDYVGFLPLNKQKTSWEVFAYAPFGLFPACHGDTFNNPLTANNRTALYSVFVEKDGTPNFNKKMNDSINQRAASPIDTLEVFRNGQRQEKFFDRIVIIVLTRNNFSPSAVIFKYPIDFAWNFAGIVVQKTDAVVGDFPDIYYNFACTDFDVVPRVNYLGRLVKALSTFPKPVTLAIINTGAPEPYESMRVRDAIAAGWYKSKFDKNLGVEVITSVPGLKELYLPWKQGGYTYKKTIENWKKQQQERRDFMGNKLERKGNCDPKKLEKLIGKPKALV